MSRTFPAIIKRVLNPLTFELTIDLGFGITCRKVLSFSEAENKRLDKYNNSLFNLSKELLLYNKVVVTVENTARSGRYQILELEINEQNYFERMEEMRKVS